MVYFSTYKTELIIPSTQTTQLDDEFFAQPNDRVLKTRAW